MNFIDVLHPVFICGSKHALINLNKQIITTENVYQTLSKSYFQKMMDAEITNTDLVTKIVWKMHKRLGWKKMSSSKVNNIIFINGMFRRNHN